MYYTAAILDPRFKAKWLEKELSIDDYLTIVVDIQNLHSKYDHLYLHSFGWRSRQFRIVESAFTFN